MQRVCLLLLTILAVSCSHSYYIVRHAEKAGATNGTIMASPNDPPLSERGLERAEVLAKKLKHKHIHYIFSTNTIRTLATAAPLSKAIGVQPILYGPTPDSAFIHKLQTLKKNVLIIGHSNTVDDIVNGLCKAVKVTGDLPDSEYNNLFIVTYKGDKIKYRRKHYGAP